MKRPRFSLRTLLLLSLFCGAAGLIWTKRDPWQLDAVLQNSNPLLEKQNALFKHEQPFIIVAPQQATLIVLLNQSQIRLWDLKTYKLITSIDFPTHSVDDIAYAPDRSRMLVLMGKKTPQLYDMRTGELCGEISGASGSGFNPLFSRDSKLILVSSGALFHVVSAHDGKPANTPHNFESMFTDQDFWVHNSARRRSYSKPNTMTAQDVADREHYGWTKDTIVPNTIFGATATEAVHIWKRCRLDGWTGFLNLPEVWIGLVLLVLLCVSLWKDQRELHKTPAVV